MAVIMNSSAMATRSAARPQAPRRMRAVQVQAVQEQVATRRGLLSMATFVGLSALANKSTADELTPARPFPTNPSNSKLSDNPVANDAQATLRAAKDESTAINAANSKSGSVGLPRIEVPQGNSEYEDPSKLGNNESFGARTVANFDRNVDGRNPLQRFADATADNYRENIVGGDIEQARKAAAQSGKPSQ